MGTEKCFSHMLLIPRAHTIKTWQINSMSQFFRRRLPNNLRFTRTYCGPQKHCSVDTSLVHNNIDLFDMFLSPGIHIIIIWQITAMNCVVAYCFLLFPNRCRFIKTLMLNVFVNPGIHTIEIWQVNSMNQLLFGHCFQTLLISQRHFCLIYS